MGTVQFFHSLIALMAAAVGTLLLLLWASGFLPEFLDQQSLSLILVKPVPRWALLAGKFFGVLLFVALQVACSSGAPGWQQGIATGALAPRAVLVAIPLLVLLFAILYAFSALRSLCGRTAFREGVRLRHPAVLGDLFRREPHSLQPCGGVTVRRHEESPARY